MKRRAMAFLLIIAAAAWLSYLAGCTLFPVSVEGRVDQFVGGLNEVDRSTMYLNFDSSITLYDDIKASTFWNSYFDPDPGAFPYVLSSLVASDPASVTFHLVNSNAESWNVEMAMVQVGESWFITELWLNGVQRVY